MNIGKVPDKQVSILEPPVNYKSLFWEIIHLPYFGRIYAIKVTSNDLSFLVVVKSLSLCLEDQANVLAMLFAMSVTLGKVTVLKPPFLYLQSGEWNNICP